MDIVEKLRSQVGDDVQHVFDHEALFRLAADEIDRLREALAWYAAPIPARTHWLVNAKGERISDMSIWGDRARDALSPTKEPKA